MSATSSPPRSTTSPRPGAGMVARAVLNGAGFRTAGQVQPPAGSREEPLSPRTTTRRRAAQLLPGRRGKPELTRPHTHLGAELDKPRHHRRVAQILTVEPPHSRHTPTPRGKRVSVDPVPNPHMHKLGQLLVPHREHLGREPRRGHDALGRRHGLGLVNPARPGTA
jgi:hypothetical protein